MKKTVAKKVTAEVKKPKKSKPTATNKRIVTVKEPFKKSNILGEIATAVEVPKNTVGEVLTELEAIISAHVKQGVAFTIPGLLKIEVVNKPAKAARKGRNPFTGKDTIFPAKPAHKAVKVKALKRLKEMA